MRSVITHKTIKKENHFIKISWIEPYFVKYIEIKLLSQKLVTPTLMVSLEFYSCSSPL